MNRKSKFLALLLTLLMCMSVFTAFTAFAVGEDETIENPETYDTEYVEPTTEYVEPETEYIPPETQAPTEYVEPETYAPETEEQVQTEEQVNYDVEDEDYDYEYSGNDSYEERENNTTNEKAETAAVYDAEDDDVSTDTLKKSDWTKIAEQLKNASGDDGDDFAFIRNNDPNSGNNGEWMLILGIAMEAAGLGIIIWLVVMKARQKKAIKVGANNGRGNGGTPSGMGRASKPDKPQRAARSEKASKPQRFSQKQRSKFDTADIVVPKHAKQPSGGKRYKPKH
ncbi:MAG: hypothetical protein IJ725_04385 [Ruminococcus sp.]|nr:hypothetical protein [Ruminococcus sp.]